MNDENDEKAPTTPPARRRILLIALTPVVLLLLLTVGMRLASDAAERQATVNDAPMPSVHQDGKPRPNHKGPQIAPVKTADKATQHTVESLIRSQLIAIRADNFSEALQYSAPGFRNSTTPDRFRTMIYANYSPMATMHSVSFKAAQIRGGGMGMMRQCIVEADIQTQTGALMKYGYMLLGDANGWYVEGVSPVGMSPAVKQAPEPPHPMPGQPQSSMPADDLHQI